MRNNDRLRTNTFGAASEMKKVIQTKYCLDHVPVISGTRNNKTNKTLKNNKLQILYLLLSAPRNGCSKQLRGLAPFECEFDLYLLSSFFCPLGIFALFFEIKMLALHPLLLLLLLEPFQK